MNPPKTVMPGLDLGIHAEVMQGNALRTFASVEPPSSIARTSPAMTTRTPPTTKTDSQKLRDAVVRVHHKILNAAEGIVDSIAAAQKPEAARVPAQVARRQIANNLKLARWCPKSLCRRTRCCRGEPLHCLQMAIPLLPPGAFDGLLHKRRPATRRGRPA